MKPYYERSGITIFNADCADALATLPDCSVQCAVTSPPYFGLRAYLPDGHADKTLEIGTEQTPNEYVARLVAVFREVKRVLRDDGTLWLNLGDSYMGGGPHHGDKNLGKSGTNKGSATARDRVEASESRFRLRQDLTPEQETYVLAELAKARSTSSATQEGLP